MKKFFLMAGMAIIASLCFVSCEPGGGNSTKRSAKLWPAYEDNSKKWGYINENGEWAFEARFSEAHDFSESYALAKSGGALEFIGTDGNRVSGVPAFDYCSGVFHNGYVSYQKGGYWGLLNSNLQIVIDPYYQQLGEMSNIGLISCQKNHGDSYGYIDKEKNQKVEALYDRADEFIDGVAVVKRGENIFAINKSNITVIQPNYSQLYSLGNDRLSFFDTNRRKFGLLSTEGREIGSPIYEELNAFTDNGLARVKIDGKYGYINKDGNEINLSNGRAYAATDFHEGIAFVKYVETGDYEAVDVNGARKFSLGQGQVPYGHFHNGLCLVWSKDTKGQYTFSYINTTGNSVRDWFSDGYNGRPYSAAVDQPTATNNGNNGEGGNNGGGGISGEGGNGEGGNGEGGNGDSQRRCWMISYYYNGVFETFYDWATESEILESIAYVKEQEPEITNITYRPASPNDEDSCEELNEY